MGVQWYQIEESVDIITTIYVHIIFFSAFYRYLSDLSVTDVDIKSVCIMGSPPEVWVVTPAFDAHDL